MSPLSREADSRTSITASLGAAVSHNLTSRFFVGTCSRPPTSSHSSTSCAGAAQGADGARLSHTRSRLRVAGNTPSERLSLKDALLRFFKDRAKEDDSGISYSKGDGYSLGGSHTVKPIYDFLRRDFMTSFCGKASPEMLGDMIQLIAYWRYWRINKDNKSVVPVPFIVSDYLGVDCNGFIGNYLQTKYAGNSLGPSSTEYTYHSKGKKTRRKRFQDIRMDDVIVFEGYHHVSLVQELVDLGRRLGCGRDLRVAQQGLRRTAVVLRGDHLEEGQARQAGTGNVPYARRGPRLDLRRALRLRPPNG